jgi:phage baseplate assembly protein W
MANHGSVPFRPLYGANLGNLLFSLSTDLEKEDVRIVIKETLRDHEPRVKVQKVIVDIEEDYNSISIQVIFEVISTLRVETVNVNIARIR